MRLALDIVFYRANWWCRSGYRTTEVHGIPERNMMDRMTTQTSILKFRVFSVFRRYVVLCCFDFPTEALITE